MRLFNRVGVLFFLGFPAIIAMAVLPAPFDLSTPEGQSLCSRALVRQADADYVANVEKYVEQTDRVTPNVQETRETFIRLLPEQAQTIISIGEGFGRDVKFFRAQGLRAIGTDGTLEMVHRSHAYLATTQDFYHVTAQDFSLAAVGLKTPVDGIWAMASLHHVPTHELAGVFAVLRDAVRPGGLIYASFIMGVGNPDQAEVAIQRFWSRISAPTLHQVVSSVPGLEVIDTSGIKSNDFFAQVPQSGFHFYNLWLRRR